MKLAEQLRACHVKRWHIVQTSREQTVAEHSFAVAVISGSLAVKMGWPEIDSYAGQLSLLHWALSHDLIEVKTGDIPTPFKAVLGAAALDQAEGVVDAHYAATRREMERTSGGMIVKLADMIDAVWFLTDCGIGNHAFDVLVKLRDQLDEDVERYANEYPALKVAHAVQEVLKELRLP